MLKMPSIETGKAVIQKMIGKMIALLVILAFAVIVYYIVFPSRGFITSDSTDTILWAQASYDSGQIISSDFNYAAVLPFGGSLLMLPFIPFFGVSMTTQSIGMILFAALFFLAIAFLCQQMGFTARWQLAVIFLLTLNLSASDKLREMLWGHVLYYSLGLLFLFVSLGLIFKELGFAERKAYRRTGLSLLILFIFVALTAANGVQVLALYALPIAGALFVEIYLNGRKSLIHKDHINAWVLVAVLLAASVCGLLLRKWIEGPVTAGYADAHAYYTDMKNWIPNIETMVIGWFSLLGVTVRDSDKLFTLASIANIIRITYGLVLVILPISFAVNYRKIDDYLLKILFSCHMIVTALVCFLFVAGKLSGAAWRLTPVVGTAVLFCLAYCRYLLQKKLAIRIARTVLLLSLATAILAMGAIVTMRPDNTDDNKLYRLSQALQDQDLDYGYATFWQANAITLISDSRVKARNITVTEKGIIPEGYQSQPSWYQDQKGVSRYFLLLSDNEMITLAASPMWTQIQAIAGSHTAVEGFHIVVLNQNPFK